MRIAYVLPLEMNIHSGVLQKVRQQVKEWECQGNHVTCYFISSVPLSKDITLNHNEKIISFSSLRVFKLGRFLTRSLAIPVLKKELEIDKPDILYYRYVFWFPGICGFLNNYNTIIEMNSHDINEFEAKSFLLLLVYKPIRRMVLRSSNAAISVSENIHESLKGYVKSNHLIPNGFSFTDEISKLNTARTKKIVFVSTPGQYWQGVDIMISIMDRLNDYTLDIVGWTYEDFNICYPKIKPTSNVFFRGYKLKSELEKIFKTSGYAFNALAMHRKGMTHNSALKTSEYLNQNLPIISGYIETGLKTNAILNINTQAEMDVYIDRIKFFLEFWSDKDINISEVREQVGIGYTEATRMTVFKKSLKQYGE